MEIYILLILVFLVYHQYKFQSNYPTMLNETSSNETSPNETIHNETMKMIKNKLEKIEEIKNEMEEIKNETEEIKRDTMNRDIKVIHKVDYPPERRLPNHILRKYKNRVNIRTRGYPDNYTLQGILVRNTDEKTLQLYGRQTYPGSNIWEYYGVGNDTNAFNSKLPIDVPNNRELYDNDEINLKYLDTKKGPFKVKLYELDSIRYMP